MTADYWDDSRPEDPRHLTDGPPPYPDPRTPAAPLCRCRHIKADHITVRGAVICGSVCGCAEYRPTDRSTP